MQTMFPCPRCGQLVAFGTRFCGNCGVSLNWPAQQQMKPPPVYQQQPPREWSQQSMSAPNTSGQGKRAIVPYEIKGWNWGAFLLPFWWGIFNRVWIMLLGLIPIANVIMPFVLGAKGNEWAWQSKRWDSVEHFRRTQRTWMFVGLGLVVLPIIILGAYFIYDYFFRLSPPSQVPY